MLADAAQVSDGKLYILGGGWTFTGPEPSTMAIAAVVEVPWDETNIRQKFTLSLNDEDGHVLLLDGPEGPRGVSVEGEFEVGRPPGLTPGASLNFPLAFNFGALPLPAGRRLVWTLEVQGEVSVKAFNTREVTAPSL